MFPKKADTCQECNHVTVAIPDASVDFRLKHIERFRATRTGISNEHVDQCLSRFCLEINRGSEIQQHEQGNQAQMLANTKIRVLDLGSKFHRSTWIQKSKHT